MGRWGWIVSLGILVSLTAGCPRKPPEPEPAPEVGTDLMDDRLGATEGPTEAGTLAAAQSGRSPEPGPLEDIHFEYDSFDLDEQARETLQDNAAWLKANPGTRVELEGHCDERGTVEYNLALGAKRAAAAKSYMVSLGVVPDRITTISYGEELPLCHEPTESCWRRNRRGHFVVIGR